MSYGEKISELRRKSGMTQATLGAKLNVTYQAVSKWERDESDPDFATMSKIAKLFDVPLTYFDEESGEEIAAAQPEAQQMAAQSEAQPAPSEYQSAEAQTASAGGAPASAAGGEGVVNGAQPAEPEAQRQARERKRQRELEKFSLKRKRNRGFIGGGIITAALLVATIVGVALSSLPTWLGAALCAAVAVFGFTFISQLFWDGFIVDVVLCGVKIIGTPGIIFTFDLDGFIFLIIMKILFALLKIFVLFLSFFFFVFIAILMSPVAFITQTIKLSVGKDV